MVKFKDGRRRLVPAARAAGRACSISITSDLVRLSLGLLDQEYQRGRRRLPGDWIRGWGRREFASRRARWVDAAMGCPMPSHKFHVGESVTLRPAISRNVPGGLYEVTKQLPHRGRRRPYRAMMRKPSCLISCSQSSPEGGLGAFVGGHGANKVPRKLGLFGSNPQALA
jgi:hypothetical protein